MSQTTNLCGCDYSEPNLAALRVRQEALADCLSRVDLPADVEWVEARDGTPNCRLHESDGTWHWLGRTSMPRVRAQALVEGLADDAGNVLVSPMGSGMEAINRLERTATHCAVFVYDVDLSALRLALTLRDFSAALRDGRLVLLTGPDPGEAIDGFFHDWPGYEFPQKLLAPPYVSRGDVEALRQSVDRSAASVVQMQTERVGEIAESLARRDATGGDVERVAILTVDPREGVIEMAAGLRRVVGEFASVSTPDSPDRCHHLARMQTLTESSATSVVLLNCGWGGLSAHVPDDLPTVSWLLPGSPILKGMTDGFGAHHIVFGATPDLCEQVVELGVDGDRVHLLEIGCDDTMFAKSENGGAVIEAAFVGDVVDLRPEAFRIELSSQVAIWKSVCLEAAKRLFAPAEEVMAAAERSCGVVVGDDRLRQHLLTMIRHSAMPTLVRRAAVQSLHDGGIDVQVFGKGWEHSRVVTSRVHPSPGSPAARNELFNSARVVVCPFVDDLAVRTCLEVVAAGGCVLLGPLDDSLLARHPQLAELLSSLPSGDSPQAMRKYARAFLRDEDAREAACAKARGMIAGGHTLRHRWTTIRAALAKVHVST